MSGISSEEGGLGFRQFKEKSAWCPSVNELDPVINVYLKQLEARLGDIDERGRNYSNLPSDEQDALKKLKGYRDIVIKETDKGGVVVVWGRSDYCEEAYRQLRDNQVYELIDTDPLEKVKITIAKELEPLLNMGCISSDNKKYLEVSKPRLGKFYLLSKIHKRLENVPGRPILSNCGTATEKISEFLDFHVQLLVGQVDSIIEDRTDFLKKLERLGYLPSIAILCTIDVVGLYPHIPHGEGLEALREAFINANNELLVDELISLARVVLENNYFEFDEKTFQQKLGTAIGTKFAPGFANIFMGYLEEKFLSTCEFKPWVWWRFLDDVADRFLDDMASFRDGIRLFFLPV